MESLTPGCKIDKPIKQRQVSYQSQKIFLDNIVSILSTNPSDEVAELLLVQLYDVLRTFGIPYALLFNGDLIQILSTLYQQNNSDVSDIIRTIFTTYIELFNFDMPTQSSVTCVISSVNSLGIQVDSPKRTVLTPFENRYKAFSALLEDCVALKSWLENPEIAMSFETENIEAILARIKDYGGVNKASDIKDCNNNYVEEFFGENERMLVDYEAFFVDFVKKNQTQVQPVMHKEIIDYPVIKSELKTRTFFYLNEKLKEDEGIDIEYKQYQYPFQQILIETIKNQICAFLNMNGGRIYFGITDMKIVKGMQLNHKSKDTLRNELVNYTSDFYPKCRTKYLEVRFIPVIHKTTQKAIPNLYVVKLIIKQGDTSKLYSVKSKGFSAYIRMPGQIVPLSAEEITQEILNRNVKPKQPIDQTEFEDSVPEIDIEEQNRDPPNVQRPNTEKKSEIIFGDSNYFVCVAVQGISTNTTESEVNELFKETNPISKRVFVNREEKCLGWAYFNYPDLYTAMQVIAKYQGLILNGSKLSLRIKKPEQKK